jgi:hypothetical protein
MLNKKSNQKRMFLELCPFKKMERFTWTSVAECISNISSISSKTDDIGISVIGC